MTASAKKDFSQGIYQVSATQKERLGTIQVLADGRIFRYSQAGSSALSAGKMGQAPTAVANHINRNPASAVSVGANTVEITVGATAVTADQYKDGWLFINNGAGAGGAYRIDSNTACDASGTTIVTLADPIMEALTTSSTVSLYPNNWKGVAESATEENLPAGVPLVDVPADYYYWAQTGGLANVLISGTPAVGTMLVMASTAGAVGAMNATLDIDQPVVGIKALAAGVDGQYGPVYLLIDR